MRTILILIMAGCLSVTAGCSRSTVDAGEEGVMTYKPYIFGKGGVDPSPIKAGAIWTVWSTSVDRYNVKPVKYTEKFFDLTASDNVAIDFSAYLTLEIQKGKSPALHEFSGEKWYTNTVKDTFRSFVRNEARTRTSIGLRTDERLINSMRKKIKEQITIYLSKSNIPVNVVKVNIGKVIPPDEVLEESAKTAAQKQRKQTQYQRKLAEDARVDAEKSTALADKAYTKEFGMNVDQFLRNKELDIMSKAVETGTVSLIINASNATPIFNASK